MKVLVSVKRVSDPDNANKVKVSGDAGRVTTDGLEWKPNPFDDYAIETALRLTENGETKERKGEVIAVSIGPKEATQVVRQALAMGAERGILIEATDEALDATVVARALKVIVEKEKPDVVVLGKQTVDGESNAAGQMLAEWLGWPMATLTTGIKTTDGAKTLEVTRESDVGLVTMKLSGPAVITVSDRILSPKSIRNGMTAETFAYPEADAGRYASLKGIMAAKKKPIEELQLAALGIETKPASRYTAFELPPARSGQTTFVENAQQLVQKLRNEAKVI